MLFSAEVLLMRGGRDRLEQLRGEGELFHGTLTYRAGLGVLPGEQTGQGGSTKQLGGQRERGCGQSRGFSSGRAVGRETARRGGRR